VTLSRHLRPLLWDTAPARIDPVRHAEFLLARVLDFGTLRDVHGLIDFYGKPRIHRFLRESGHPELSRRTIAFWRSCFKAEHETWRQPPDFRRNTSSFWVA
jgi:hypothetical protein